MLDRDFLVEKPRKIKEVSEILKMRSPDYLTHLIWRFKHKNKGENFMDKLALRIAFNASDDFINYFLDDKNFECFRSLEITNLDDKRLKV